jgi:hypothetical protein
MEPATRNETARPEPISFVVEVLHLLPVELVRQRYQATCIMGVKAPSPPFLKRIFHFQSVEAARRPTFGRKAFSNRILPVTTDEPQFHEKKSSISSPRSALSLPVSLPNLTVKVRRGRRAPIVQFSDVAIRVFEVTTYPPSPTSDGDEKEPAPKEPVIWTLDWKYSDYSTKLPINQFEAFHREGNGIRSRTRAQLPKDFERLYRLSRCSIPTI